MLRFMQDYLRCGILSIYNMRTCKVIHLRTQEQKFHFFLIQDQRLPLDCNLNFLSFTCFWKQRPTMQRWEMERSMLMGEEAKPYGLLTIWKPEVNFTRSASTTTCIHYITKSFKSQLQNCEMKKIIIIFAWEMELLERKQTYISNQKTDKEFNWNEQGTVTLQNIRVGLLIVQNVYKNWKSCLLTVFTPIDHVPSLPSPAFVSKLKPCSITRQQTSQSPCIG